MDHLSLDSLLQATVTLEGLPAPQKLSALLQTQINSFESAHGPSSDTQYLNTAVAGHQQSLLIYQTEALSGADPLLRSYPQGSVATIQGHLNQASNLLASSGSFRARVRRSCEEAVDLPKSRLPRYLTARGCAAGEGRDR